jgi:hypothetical protein
MRFETQYSEVESLVLLTSRMTREELRWHDGVEGHGLGVAGVIGIGEELGI